VGSQLSSYPAVDQRLLRLVDGWGWPPFRLPVGVNSARPAAGSEIVVVISAQQGQIVEVGFAAVDPFSNVVQCR
jgi:hypothetical protein